MRSGFSSLMRSHIDHEALSVFRFVGLRQVAELVDLLQGRIPRSVFARHYLKVGDLKALVSQVLAVTSMIERDLLS
jgi:hypothetical protein